MYRVQLSDEQRSDLQRRTRGAGLKRRTRDRLEMVRWADTGRSIPQIARVLGGSEVRVRYWIKRYLDQGFDALVDQPHAGRRSRLTPELLATLRAELEESPRTWTTGQLAEWLEQQHGVRLTPDHLGRLLRRAQCSCHRTERGLRHKQDPVQVASGTADLRTLEKGGRGVLGCLPRRPGGVCSHPAHDLELGSGRSPADRAL